MPNGEEQRVTETQLTETQFKAATWYVEHKLKLKKIGLGILIGFNVLALGYGLFGIVDYYLLSWNRDLTMRREAVLSRISGQVLAAIAPTPLLPISVQALPTSNGKVDFLAKIQNTNPDWYVSFQYQFSAGGMMTEPQEGFILPLEEKYLFALAQEISAREAQLVITDYDWHRTDHRTISDIESWKAARLNFVLEDVTHTPSLQIDTSVGRTSFKVENRTAYGYWRVGFPVVLLRGTTPAAVNYIALDNFDAGEKRQVDVNWFERLPATTEADIRPEVNLFEPDVYMPPKAE